MAKKKAASGGNGVAIKRRVAISLTKAELKQVEERAKRFSMTDAAFCAHCVKFYLSHYAEDAALRPLKQDDQPRLDV